MKHHITPRPENIIPPSSAPAGPTELWQPVGNMKAQLRMMPEGLSPWARLSLGLRNELKMMEVAKFQSDKVADACKAIVDMAVDAYTDDLRQKFFIGRARDSAELRSAILEFSTEIRQMLQRTVHKFRGSIFEEHKRELDEIDSRLAKGKITEDDAEIWREAAREERAHIFDGLKSDLERVQAAAHRDLDHALG